MATHTTTDINSMFVRCAEILGCESRSDPGELRAAVLEKARHLATAGRVGQPASKMTKEDRQQLTRYFDQAFDKAVDAGRAMPSQRAGLRRFFARDADAALRLLSALAPVAQVGADAPEGVDQHSHELDRRIRAYMAEHKCDYVTAFEQVPIVKERPRAESADRIDLDRRVQVQMILHPGLSYASALERLVGLA